MSADLFQQIVLPLFEEHRADFLATARAAARRIAKEQGTICIDDVRAVCAPPPDIDPRIMGAVLKGGEFEAVGFRKSSRRTCHNRPITMFRLRHSVAA